MVDVARTHLESDYLSVSLTRLPPFGMMLAVSVNPPNLLRVDLLCGARDLCDSANSATQGNPDSVSNEISTWSRLGFFSVSTGRVRCFFRLIDFL